MTFRAEVQKDFASNTFTMRVARVGFETCEVLTAFEWTAIPEGQPFEGVTLCHQEATGFLQAMMDAAYEVGLRPSRAQDERHMKSHLEDMRSIAMHQLGIKGQ